jgi:hypothetical protein
MALHPSHLIPLNRREAPEKGFGDSCKLEQPLALVSDLPKLVVDNGMGEINTVPSPIVSRYSSEDSMFSDETLPDERVNDSSPSIVNGNTNLLESNESDARHYSASSNSSLTTMPPPQSQRRSLSPPKMIISPGESKPGAV